MNKVKKTTLIILLFVLSLAVLTACGSKQEAYPPEDIEEGVDRCEVCNMLVPNDHNATQLLLTDGRSLKFDDIGDMAVWVKENGLDDVNIRYVRDYYTEEWLPIEKATFVYDSEFRTPMAYGIYSFKSKEEAEKFIQEAGTGKLLTYADLEQHSWAQNMELMDHGHGHHEHGHNHDHTDGHDHEHGEDDEHRHEEHDAHELHNDEKDSEHKQ